MMDGVKKCAHAVGGTMGTAGANAVIEAIESPGYLMTNDGATILNSIKLADPLEDLGRKTLVEAVNRANKQSGDGSSTTTVLTAAILEEGSQLKGVHPMEVKKSLEGLIPVIEKELKSMSCEIALDEVGVVATVSSEDPQIGATIQEIYKQIGKDGVIHWDISKTTEDSYKIGTGITIEGAGYLSPYMCDMDEKTGQLKTEARWSNPKILITRQKVTSASDFNDLFASLNADGIKEVVVFCDEIEATVIPDLVQTRIVRGFKAMVIKMPVLWKDWWFEDIAKAAGATIIDPNAGLTLKTTNKSHLGTFSNILVTREDTYIDGIKDLTEHIKALEEDGSDDSKLRASRLNTRTARYYIGAHSDTALSYKRLKVEDAISAAYQALHGGVVPGGGVALFNVARNLYATQEKSPVVDMLASALLAPARQIATNAGVLFDPSEYGGNRGLNTKTGQYVDMLEANIINPTTVEINACKNAISVAAGILTANTVVTLPREHETLR